MIMCSATHDLLLFLATRPNGATVAEIQDAGRDPSQLEALVQVGFADEDGRTTESAFDFLINALQARDPELTGQRTPFGTVLGMVIPNDGRIVRITFVRSGQPSEVTLPGDCWLQVLP